MNKNSSQGLSDVAESTKKKRAILHMFSDKSETGMETTKQESGDAVNSREWTASVEKIII